MTWLTLLAGSFAGMQLMHGSSPPAGRSSAVEIEEVLANNRTLVADEAGQFEDYIVLRNTSHVAVEIGGMYLSDDLDRPRRWMIPDGTILPPAKRVRIWADNEPLDGPLHACFKLSRNGERVLLFDTDARRNAPLDGVCFSRQQPDTPFRR